MGAIAAELTVDCAWGSGRSETMGEGCTARANTAVNIICAGTFARTRGEAEEGILVDRVDAGPSVNHPADIECNAAYHKGNANASSCGNCCSSSLETTTAMHDGCA